MKVFEMVIDDEAEHFINMISLVDEPAIESNFIALSKEELSVRLSINDEKKEIVGAVLIPDLKIPRKAPNGEIFQIFFSAETIKEAAKIFMQRRFTNKVNLNHNTSIEDVYVSELWLKEDEKLDKSNMYGLELPINSWVVKMNVEDNDEVWEKVKENIVNGFSIEGMFAPKLVTNLSAQPLNVELDKKLISVEKWVLGKTEKHCEVCEEYAAKKNSNGGVWFIKGTFEKPPIHKGCKCRIDTKVVKDNPKNFK